MKLVPKCTWFALLACAGLTWSVSTACLAQEEKKADAPPAAAPPKPLAVAAPAAVKPVVKWEAPVAPPVVAKVEPKKADGDAKPKAKPVKAKAGKGKSKGVKVAAKPTAAKKAPAKA